MEVTALSSGFLTAREIGMSRLAAEAWHFQAEGVVGMTIDIHATPRHSSQNSEQLSGLIVHFTAFGTAVAREDFKFDPGKIELNLPMS
jgi:uncharacterized protein YbjQ (UPF0145 family)